MVSKKHMLLATGFLVMLIAQGCETPKAVSHSAGSDTTTVVDKIQKADQWISDNLW
ncbi:MAG: hypothetical protein KA403_02065 [Candidatus Omnitrophica bacterium]|nr:hypothetical protein [Candidatus Omnitrophota bacterium]